MSSNDVPRHRPLVALTSALAVGALAVAITTVDLPPPSGSTAADTVVQPAVSPPGVSPTGWIAIETGSTSQVTYHDVVDGTASLVQALTPGNNCSLAQGTDPTARYVTFAGSLDGGGTFKESLASYENGSIGVKEKKSGTSCSRADSPVEVLDLKLGGALPSGTMASSAFLDLEMKQSARILATAKLNGQTQATFELQSGATAGLEPPIADYVQQCTGSADSGPDSGTNDNCRWAISVPSWTDEADDGIYFDELVLEPLNGSFSLEGGADGSYEDAPLSPAKASIIEVVDQTLDCGDRTQTILAVGDAPEVTVTRLGNADASPCAPVPYSIDSGVLDGLGFAQFLKPLNTQVNAQFLWDMQWTFDATADSTDIPGLLIDWESGAATNPWALGWCPNPVYDSAGSFTGLTTTPTADQDPDDLGGWPGVQYACVVSRTSTATATDQVVSRDLVYVFGDARMKSG